MGWPLSQLVSEDNDATVEIDEISTKAVGSGRWTLNGSPHEIFDAGGPEYWRSSCPSCESADIQRRPFPNGPREWHRVEGVFEAIHLFWGCNHCTTTWVVSYRVALQLYRAEVTERSVQVKEYTENL